jgi:anaerobic selenocysteine-containing dehydrogenase
MESSSEVFKNAIDKAFTSQPNVKINAKTMLALLRAILNYILDYDLVDHKFVKSKTSGLDELTREMKKYPFN